MYALKYITFISIEEYDHRTREEKHARVPCHSPRLGLELQVGRRGIGTIGHGP
jgi:hypothetical protein